MEMTALDFFASRSSCSISIRFRSRRSRSSGVKIVIFAAEFLSPPAPAPGSFSSSTPVSLNGSFMDLIPNVLYKNRKSNDKMNNPRTEKITNRATMPAREGHRTHSPVPVSTL
jgi:hypothetical protein